MKLISSILLLISITLTAGCIAPDTSVDQVTVSPGNVPAELLGTYNGAIKGKATPKKLAIVKQSFNDAITLKVAKNNTVSFSSTFASDTVTTVIGSNGGFNTVLSVDQGDCTGSVNISGTVTSSSASGQIGGEGDCEGVEVAITGSFSATK